MSEGDQPAHGYAEHAIEPAPTIDIQLARESFRRVRQPDVLVRADASTVGLPDAAVSRRYTLRSPGHWPSRLSPSHAGCPVVRNCTVASTPRILCRRSPRVPHGR